MKTACPPGFRQTVQINVHIIILNIILFLRNSKEKKIQELLQINVGSVLCRT
jgi:hypothetical protein